MTLKRAGDLVQKTDKTARPAENKHESEAEGRKASETP